MSGQFVQRNPGFAQILLEDIAVFNELCEREGVGAEWCAAYFAEVQESVEADLKNAILGDVKTLRDSAVLPPRVAQLCVWDTDRILAKLSEIREHLACLHDSWLLNIIDIKKRCSYFVCDDGEYSAKIEKVFDIRFEASLARTEKAYLRKEIIKKTHLKRCIGG